MKRNATNPQTGESSRATELSREERIVRYVGFAAAALALLYALVAGLRTAGDPDLGWQLATGRWIVQHQAIPFTDILSYTGRGQEWIYPVLSQVVLYLTYLLGGYALLSWLSAAACVGSTALLLRGNTVSKFLAIIAVPMLVARTAPRAELFTTVLFAAFVNILWFYHKLGRGPLWTLPVLMAFWVNLHQGFVSGLGMCAAYVFLELADAVSSDHRKAALNRLRAATPWLLAVIVATLLNPWGARNYAGMFKLLPVHSNRLVVELLSVRLTPGKLLEAFAWRDPRSAMWWLILAVITALFVSLYRRRFAPAILFAVSLYLVIHALRFQGPFATVAVIIGGSVLSEFFESTPWRHASEALRHRVGLIQPGPVMLGLVVLCACFVGVRSLDLITDRTYLRIPSEFSSFGPGVSWWYPEEAAAFLKSQRLPGNIFNDYTVGGFVAWRLSPEYPDYIDGRGNPFGDQALQHSIELAQEPIGSPSWQHEADAKGINTVLLSMNPEIGPGIYSIKDSCESTTWRPVYLDAKAAIFVRVRPETQALLDRLAIDCDKVSFDTPPVTAGMRSKSDRFNYYLNSAAILAALGRDSEALHQLELAQSISENFYLHFLKGVELHRSGVFQQAEAEWRKSLEMEPSESAALALEEYYKRQGRYGEAEHVLQQAADVVLQPFGLYLELGSLQLDMQMPKDALSALDKAEKFSPFGDNASGRGFNSRLFAERARAYYGLSDLSAAISSQNKSVQLDPENCGRWLKLAEFYQGARQMQAASDVRIRAAKCGNQHGSAAN